MTVGGSYLIAANGATWTPSISQRRSVALPRLPGKPMATVSGLLSSDVLL